jgi:hypothetical protein
MGVLRYSVFVAHGFTKGIAYDVIETAGTAIKMRSEQVNKKGNSN